MRRRSAKQHGTVARTSEAQDVRRKLLDNRLHNAYNKLCKDDPGVFANSLFLPTFH